MNPCRRAYSRAFTLIELLVVIAIIGLLASIILASLSNAKAKGQDAAVKQEMKQAQSQAEVFYVYNNSYHNGSVDVCTTVQTSKGIADLLAAAAAKSGVAGGATVVNGTIAYNHVSCESSATAYAVEAPLAGSASGTGNEDMWCVDSTGRSVEENPNPTAFTTSTYKCP